MNNIDPITEWAKGDILQGKWMIGISIFVMLPVLIFLVKNGGSLQKGMALPLGFLFLVNLGYAGFMLSSKPQYSADIEKLYRQNPTQTFKHEYKKIKDFDRSYTLTKYLWAALLAGSVIAYFIISDGYFQGLTIGFALMFVGLLIVDVFLHSRLKVCLAALSQNNLLD